MSCPTLSSIAATECIGASLPKINGNFAALSGGLCQVSADYKASFNALVHTLSGFAVTAYPTLSTQFRSLSSLLVP